MQSGESGIELGAGVISNLEWRLAGNCGGMGEYWYE